jgi:membrane-bound serine protease (ClpP class)
VTADQIVLAAIGGVLLILVVVGIGRAVSRRRAASEDAFGAGGQSQVAIGTTGVAKTALAPSGVVLAAGEQWTAKSADGSSIEEGQRIRVVGQNGLTLVVAADQAGPAMPATE